MATQDSQGNKDAGRGFGSADEIRQRGLASAGKDKDEAPEKGGGNRQSDEVGRTYADSDMDEKLKGAGDDTH